MTAGELIAQLAALPPDTPVLVTGYEGGFAPCTLGVLDVQEVDRTDGSDYLGQYVTPDVAAEELDGRGGVWRYMVGGEPPVLVGEPFQAAILMREGR